MTTEEYLNLIYSYEEYLIEQGYSKRTARECKLSALHLMRDHPRPWRTLQTERDVVKWAGSGRTPGAANRLILFSFRFLNFVKKYGGGYDIKWAEHEKALPKVRRGYSKKIIVVPPPEKMLAVIKCEPEYDNRMVLTAMYACGLRRNEVTLLDISDFSRGSLKVSGKGGKERLVPLPESAIKNLGKYIETRLQETEGADGPMFTTHGKWDRIKPHHIDTLCKIAGERVGIKLNPHLIRHAFATHMLEAGLPVTDLSRLLGHSSLDMTWKYVHTVASPASANYHPMNGGLT